MLRLVTILLLITIQKPVLAQCLSRSVLWDTTNSDPLSLSDPALIPYLHELQRICRHCGYEGDSVEARVNTFIGRTFYKLHYIDSARLYTHRAIHILSQGKERVNLSENVLNFYLLSLIEKRAGDSRKQQAALHKCIAAANEFPEHAGVAAQAYADLAEIHFLAGDYVDCKLQAELGESRADTGDLLNLKSDLILWQARALFALGQTNQAQVLLVHASRLALQASSPGDAADFFLKAGHLMEDLGKTEEAASFYRSGITRVSPHIQYRHQYAELCEAMGGLYPDQPTKADYYFHQAFAFTGDLRKKAKIALRIGEVSHRNRKIAQALSFYQKGLAFMVPGFKTQNLTDNPRISELRKVTDKIALIDLLNRKGRAWSDSANKTYEKLITRREIASQALTNFLLADSLLSYVLLETPRPKEGWSKLVKPLFESALENCLLSERSDLALHFVERGKFFALIDRFGNSGALLKLTPEERESYFKESREIFRYRRLIEDEGIPAKDVILFNSRLYKLLDSRQQFIQEQLDRNPFLKNFVHHQSRLTPSHLQKEILQPMGDSSAYLTFLEGDRFLYGVLVTSDSVTLRKSSRSEFVPLASEYLDLISAEALSATETVRFLNVSNRLYQLIYAPFPMHNKKRIVVSPSELFVPMDALSAAKEREDFLIHRHAFSYAYSFLFMEGAAIQRKPFPFHRNFLSFLPESPGMGNKEVKQIGKNFFMPTVIGGEKATKTAFTDMAWGYRVVQLRTQTENQADALRICFADHSATLSELREQPYYTQLLWLDAPLSDDSEASSRLRSSLDLAGAFSSLGISTVVTALWAADREDETWLEKQFFEYLAKGIPVDLALQKTKMGWLQKNRVSNPYRWAGIIAVGDTSPVSTDKEIYTGLWMGLGIFLLTFYVTFVYQKKRRTSQTPVEVQDIVMANTDLKQ